MTPPVMPTRELPGHEITAMIQRAHKAGYSPAQIADNLDSLGAKLGQDLSAYANDVRATTGKLRTVNAGMNRGMFTKAGERVMAGVGTAVQKLSGDDRSLGEIYDHLKADIETKSAMAMEANPKTAMAAQVAGAVVGSKGATGASTIARGGMRAAGLGGIERMIPRIATGSVGMRALNAGVSAGAYGAATGALNADPGERLRGAAEGGAFGFAGGAGASLAMSGGLGLARQMRQLASGSPPPMTSIAPPTGTAPSTALVPTNTGAPPTAGPRRLLGGARNALIGEQVPADARRMLARLDTQGKSVADLERSLTPSPNILAEDGGEKMVRDLRTARALGYNAPDDIAETLTRRAEGEGARSRAALTKAVGNPVDDVEFANERLATARANSSPEYKKFHAIGELADERMIEPLDALNTTTQRLGIGKSVLQEVEDLAELEGLAKPAGLFDPDGNMLRLPTATEADWIKRALDPIIYGSERAAKTGIQNPQTFQGARLELLKKAHRNFVQAVDDVTDGQYAKARGEFSGPMAERQSFADAQDAAGTIVATDSPERILGASKNPEATARGTGNYLHNQMGKVSEGAGGSTIQNPAQRLMTPEKQVALKVATKGDAAKLAAFEQEAKAVSKRLATYRTVMQGTQTAEKIGDMAEQLLEPSFVAKVVGKPLEAAGQIVGRVYASLGRRATGREMDELAKLLMAGAEGQMTKADAIAKLKQFEPVLQRAWAQQARTSAATGGGVARTLTNK